MLHLQGFADRSQNNWNLDCVLTGQNYETRAIASNIVAFLRDPRPARAKLPRDATNLALYKSAGPCPPPVGPMQVRVAAERKRCLPV